MKKGSSTKDTLRAEYTRADFPDGFVRGKYAARAAASSPPPSMHIHPSPKAIEGNLLAIF